MHRLIDFIKLNNFHTLNHTPAQHKVSYYGLFEKCLPWNLIYSSTCKLGQHKAKTLAKATHL